MERIIAFRDEEKEKREEIDEMGKEIFENVLKGIFEKIHFSSFQNLFSMLNEAGESHDVSRKYVIELFLKECQRVEPGVYYGTIAYVNAKKENKAAIEFLEYLENAGSKCFSAMNGFCVDCSLNIKPNCENCLFSPICESEIKNI